jgi:hypothetical protein
MVGTREPTELSPWRMTILRKCRNSISFLWWYTAAASMARAATCGWLARTATRKSKRFCGWCRISSNRQHRVYLDDVKAAASALLSRRFSLESLAKYLDTSTQKHKTDEDDETLTLTYLEYSRGNAQVTWECYLESNRRYQEHGFERSIDRLLSEASIGKAYLQEMEIRPFLRCNPTFPRERFGEILCAYSGGRAEVRNRWVIREILLCSNERCIRRAA